MASINRKEKFQNWVARDDNIFSKRSYSTRSHSFFKTTIPRSPVHLESTIKKVLSPF